MLRRLSPNGLGAADGFRSGVRHDGADLREDDADARGDARHDRACCRGNESGHQGVFDEILRLGVTEGESNFP